jgi:hypothetical protein
LAKQVPQRVSSFIYSEDIRSEKIKDMEERVVVEIVD